jgi:hypothetical protein
MIPELLSEAFSANYINPHNVYNSNTIKNLITPQPELEILSVFMDIFKFVQTFSDSVATKHQVVQLDLYTVVQFASNSTPYQQT